MTRKLLTILAAVALLVALAPAISLADTISGSASAGWQSWSATNLDNDGKPYWDNKSWDGTTKNVGYCMAGTGTCGMSSAPGALPFWGMSYNSGSDTGGAADPAFTFLSAGASTGALKIEIAGNASHNVFGWYDTTLPASGSNLHIIFAGSDTAGATATFTPSSSYGFYLDDTVVGDTWFTNTSLNTQGSGNQHFAVFSSDQTNYWIGMEDLPFCKTTNPCTVGGSKSTSDRDYNDMIVEISPVPAAVPEPGTLALFGTGLISLAGIIRRRLAA
jgi:hypothetical protein